MYVLGIVPYLSVVVFCYIHQNRLELLGSGASLASTSQLSEHGQLTMAFQHTPAVCYASVYVVPRVYNTRV